MPPIDLHSAVAPYWKNVGCRGSAVLVGQIKEGAVNFARQCGAVVRSVRKMPEHFSSPGQGLDLCKVRSTPLRRALSPSAHSGGQQGGIIERTRTSLNAKFYMGGGGVGRGGFVSRTSRLIELLPGLLQQQNTFHSSFPHRCNGRAAF